jgi:hypothetical protein
MSYSNGVLVTISRAETGWRELDFNLGVAIGAGMTREEQAEFAGCDRSNIYNRLAVNKDFIEYVANRVKAAVAASIAITTENVKAKYTAMWTKAVENLDEFLDDDDKKVRLKATFRMIDQFEGRPVERIEQKTTMDVTQKIEVFKMPGDALGALMSLVKETAQLVGKQPKALPEAVIDVEPIRGTAEGS